MKKKTLKIVAMLMVAALALTGCGSSGGGEADAPANEMQYIAVEDVKGLVEEGSSEYIILDVRKVEDYDTSHIRGSISADQDAANKGGDDAKGIENLKEALSGATGSETGNPDDKYVLVCYSGKSYAQKGTDLMIEMGIPKDKIYTLEGGMKAWEEAGDDYTGLLD